MGLRQPDPPSPQAADGKKKKDGSSNSRFRKKLNFKWVKELIKNPTNNQHS